MLAALAVLAVATIAAIVSYSHIYDLGHAHGYTPGTARLLPLSVDGLIVAASLVLLAEARAQRPAPRLARAGLVLGIAGTLAANVAYGVRFGPVGAVVNAWPAVSFIFSTEILLGQMRRAGGMPSRKEASGTVAATVPEVGPATVPSAVPVDVPVIEPVAVPVDGVTPTPVTVPRTVATGRARGRARKQAPEHAFAAELARGELPSIRAVKAKLHVGTDRARAVRDELEEILQEAPRQRNRAHGIAPA